MNIERHQDYPSRHGHSGIAQSSSDNAPSRRVRALIQRPALCVGLLMHSGCVSSTHLSFLDPQDPVADAQRWQFYWVLAIMELLVTEPIFLQLPFFVWRYRYGNRKSPATPKWEYFRLIENLFWSGPIVIVFVPAVYLWSETHELDPYKPVA